MTEPRNAEQAEINPQAIEFARAKLRMLEEERAFEDWWTSTSHGAGVGVYSDLAKAAQATHRSYARLGWMARVREVDALRAAVSAAAALACEDQTLIGAEIEYADRWNNPPFFEDCGHCVSCQAREALK